MPCYHQRPAANNCQNRCVVLRDELARYRELQTNGV